MSENDKMNKKLGLFVFCKSEMFSLFFDSIEALQNKVQKYLGTTQEQYKEDTMKEQKLLLPTGLNIKSADLGRSSIIQIKYHKKCRKTKTEKQVNYLGPIKLGCLLNQIIWHKGRQDTTEEIKTMLIYFSKEDSERNFHLHQSMD